MTDKHETSAARHRREMRRRQREVRERIARATIRRGIVIYLYGAGKGKSSSAFGTLARALGHGKRGAVVQFIKGKWKTGEQKFFLAAGNVEYHVMGTGFTWDTQDRERDTAAAVAAWEKAVPLLQNPDIDLVILDELTYMFKYGYLPVAEVTAALRRRPQQQNVIITGRDVIPELSEIADTISEVREVRHAFNHGVKAQKGIEY